MEEEEEGEQKEQEQQEGGKEEGEEDNDFWIVTNLSPLKHSIMFASKKSSPLLLWPTHT